MFLLRIFSNFLITQVPKSSEGSKSLLDQLLPFIYSIAHYIGLGIVTAIKTILPMLKNLDTLTDPIGFLAILSLFIILVSTARKIAWIIVLVGWVLIAIRIILMLLGT